MDKNEVAKQMQKELNKCEIKEANGLDGTENLINALEILASAAPQPEPKNIRAFRWKNGLSPIDKKDLVHDTNKLKDFVKQLSVAKKEDYEKLAGIIANIVVEINDDAEEFFADDVELDDLDEIYIKEYNFDRELDENKDSLCMLVNTFADEMLKEFETIHKYDEGALFVKTLAILSTIERFTTQCNN